MKGGIVYLVGAGPGDPSLMTRRSLELIAAADAILYDRLLPPGALDGARPEAELRYVGKSPGAPSVPQDEINRQLVELARAGRMVVRLKGGDPFVFGRGGEEAEALAEADIRFEVVPGVSAGVAAPAYAGIPVTHRDAASAVAFVTGHEDAAKDGSSLDWDALARFPGTLVFYMGLGKLPLIADRLERAGRDPGEPAAVVARGTLPDQAVVSGTLADIAERVADAGLRPPAITLVGPVAGLRDTLAWVERRPLHGETVAVTRARAQASGLAARLRELGAAVVETPAIRIEPRPVELPDLSPYSLICLTSPNGVRLFFEALAGGARGGGARGAGARPRDARALSGKRVAAIGPGTAAALREHGIEADVVPERFVAEGLLEALSAEALSAEALSAEALSAEALSAEALSAEALSAEALSDAAPSPEALAGEPSRKLPTGDPLAGARVLLARAAEARDVLPEGLRERGAEVDVLPLYDTVAEPLTESQRKALGTATYVTFTSSSTVRFLLEALQEAPGGAVEGAPSGAPEGAPGRALEAPPEGALEGAPSGAPADLLGAARVVSIGPVTSETLREHGIEPDVEAERHDVDGLVEALTADAAARRVGAP